MRRLLKFFAFIGGLGAIGWLVRNRGVTVTMNRETPTPEPVPEPVVIPRAGNDRARIEGLSDAQVAQLGSAGVTTISQLAEADIQAISQDTGIPEDQIAAWRESAEALVG